MYQPKIGRNIRKLMTLSIILLMMLIVLPNSASAGYYRYDLFVNVDKIGLVEGEGDTIQDNYGVLLQGIIDAKAPGWFTLIEEIVNSWNTRADDVYLKFKYRTQEYSSGNIGDYYEGDNMFKPYGREHNIPDFNHKFYGVTADTTVFITLFDDGWGDDPDGLVSIRVDIDNLGTCSLTDWWTLSPDDPAKDCSTEIDIVTSGTFERRFEYDSIGTSIPDSYYYNYNALRLDISLTRTWISTCSYCIY